MYNDKIDISIIVAVYNHEKYIIKAIKSILMQKGTYSYEVLIGEDCSTDNTRKILKKIEPSLPPQFHIFYRETNMGEMGEKNFNDLYSRSRGRYYIVLEGDDFWTYDYKLQKQFEFLENHPDCLAVAHNTEIVNEKSIPLKQTYPECKKEEYTIYDFRKGLLPGQTTTILMRNYFAFNLFDWHLEASEYPGDRKKAFLLVANGKVACIQKKWSAYRFVENQGESFSARVKKMNDEHIIDYHGPRMYFKSIYDYALSHSVRQEVVKVTEELYIKLLLSYAIHGQDGVTPSMLFRTLYKAKYPVEVIIFSIQSFIKRRLIRLLKIKKI